MSLVFWVTIVRDQSKISKTTGNVSATTGRGARGRLAGQCGHGDGDPATTQRIAARSQPVRPVQCSRPGWMGAMEGWSRCTAPDGPGGGLPGLTPSGWHVLLLVPWNTGTAQPLSAFTRRITCRAGPADQRHGPACFINACPLPARPGTAPPTAGPVPCYCYCSRWP